MHCPKCNKEMTLRVSIELTLPARFTNLISKTVIRRKDCAIKSANWKNATVTCYDCGYQDRGL